MTSLCMTADGSRDTMSDTTNPSPERKPLSDVAANALPLASAEVSVPVALFRLQSVCGVAWPALVVLW